MCHSRGQKIKFNFELSKHLRTAHLTTAQAVDVTESPRGKSLQIFMKYHAEAFAGDALPPPSDVGGM